MGGGPGGLLRYPSIRTISAAVRVRPSRTCKSTGETATCLSSRRNSAWTGRDLPTRFRTSDATSWRSESAASLRARYTAWGLALRGHFYLGQDLPASGASPLDLEREVTTELGTGLLQHAYSEFTFLSRFLRRDMFLLPRPSAAQPAGRAWLGLLLPATAVVAAFVVQAAGIAVPVVGRGWARFDPARWPMELLPTLEAIDRSSPDGAGIFNDLNFGGFLIDHTPRLRVFVDDRCSVYGGDYLQAYDRARREDPARIDRWQRQYGFRYALVETGGRFDRYLAAGPWTLVGRTEAATLYQSDLGSSTSRR